MITQITSVWQEVVSFIVTLFQSVGDIFYTQPIGETPGHLTFIGTIAVVMAGISIMLLVFNLIRSFFSFRG